MTRWLCVLASTGCALLGMATSATAMSAGGPDGSVSWVWEQEAPNRGLNVELARITPKGVPLGTVSELNPEPEAPVAYPDQTEESKLEGVVVGPGGVTTAMWLEIVAWNARIVVQRAAPDGGPLGEQITLASKQEIHIRPVIGIGPDGTVTVVWNRSASPGSEVVARRIAPDGTPEEGTLVLSGPDSSASRPDVAIAGDGTAIVVWTDRLSKDRQLLERRIAPDGTLEPTTHQLASSEFGMGGPEVDVSPDGSATVMWEQWDTVNEYELWVRHLDADGTPEASGHLLDGPKQDLIPWSARLHVASDGSALVVWSDKAGEIQALPIAADGSPADTPIAVGSAGPDGSSPAVAAEPDGDLLFVWRQSPCGAHDCLVASRVSADGSLGPTLQIDTGWLSFSGVSVGPDGTATLLWSRLFAHSPDRWVKVTRQLAPDDTLGPVYEVTHPGPEPVVRPRSEELQFWEVELGRTAGRQLSVAALSVEPVGSFAASIAGPDSDEFDLTSSSCTPSIAFPANCAIAVGFSPSRLGPANAWLHLDAGESKETVTVALSGDGIGQLALGKLMRNRAAGTAALPIAVPTPGALTIEGPCLATPQTQFPLQVEAGTIDLTVSSRSHCRAQLRRVGSTSFGMGVFFDPTVGESRVLHRRITLRRLHGNGSA